MEESLLSYIQSLTQEQLERVINQLPELRVLLESELAKSSAID
jgi:hypothetical protein